MKTGTHKAQIGARAGSEPEQKLFESQSQSWSRNKQFRLRNTVYSPLIHTLRNIPKLQRIRQNIGHEHEHEHEPNKNKNRNMNIDTDTDMDTEKDQDRKGETQTRTGTQTQAGTQMQTGTRT